MSSARSGDLFGHPRGLTILFATEMWEVFSFVGMKTMLVYYMTQQLGFGPDRAAAVYGAYSGTAYLLPVVGGVICDRWLGRRNSVVVGGILMSLGHFLLVFEPLFFPALCLVALGAGFYLPALPSQIAGLYSDEDPRKASAYGVYYVGMNLGAFLAPLVCGTLGEFWGWHWGFGVAGIGMLLGVAIYTAGSRHLPPDPLRAAPATVEPVGRGRLLSSFALILSVGLLVILYRGAYEQIGISIALWLDSGIDREIGSFEIPMTWFQSINPLMIFALTPLLVAFWTWRARRSREPALPNRMAVGAFIGAGAYLILALVALNAEAGGRSPSWMWIAAFVVILTLSELLIMPVCLALFGRLAPPGHSATAMSVFFLTVSGGNFLAGWLGTNWSSSLASSFFFMIAGVATLAGILLYLFGLAMRLIHSGSGLGGAAAT